MKNIKALLLLMVALPVVAMAQDLGGLKNQKPFNFSGGLAVRAGFYAAPDGQKARRSPYNYAVTGSPTFTFYGWSVPLSFTYHDQKVEHSKPFQRFGASPRWRWLTLHGGYRNLNFSPYTLAGHTFLGGGLEINRKRFRLAAMSGDLQNAIIQSDTAVLGSKQETFKRRAHGAKIGLGTLRNQVAFTAFRATDKIGTENLDAERRQSLHPADNIALGMDLRFTFFKRLVFESSTGVSVFTRDQLFYDVDTFENKRLEKVKAIAEKFMDINLSTRIGFAGDAALQIQFPNWALGAKYQRIEPFFTTLGAYYFQDDLENRTVTGSFRLFKGKISVNGSIGEQRNNLQGLRFLSAARLIGNGSLTVSPSPRWGVSAQFSNFRAEQGPNFQSVADTFRFVQVNRSVSVSPYFSKPGKRLSHFVSANLMQQAFDDLSEGTSVLPQNSVSRNAFFNYRLSLRPSGWRFSLGGNYNEFDISGKKSARYGATAGIGRVFFKKKLNANLSSTFNLATADGSSDSGTVQNHRLSTSLKLGKKQSLQFSLLLIRRNLPLKPAYSEQSGNIGYSLRF